MSMKGGKGSGFSLAADKKNDPYDSKNVASSIFDVQSVSCSGQFDIERNFKKANVEGLYSICFRYYKEQSEASGS